MRNVALPVEDIGADIVAPIIDANTRLYVTRQRRFVVLDVTRMPFRKLTLSCAAIASCTCRLQTFETPFGTSTEAVLGF